MKNTKTLTQAALIAALYCALTLISQAFGLASGAIQIRISEALTIMPLFTWSAVPGLAIGCLISNVLTGCALWDVILGSLATLAGAIGTYCIGRRISRSESSLLNSSEAKESISGDPVSEENKRRPAVWPASLPPIIANMAVIPPVLTFVYGADGTYLFFLGTVGIGEIISCGILGMILYRGIKGKIRW